jgi:hypothetical protein
MILHIIEPTLNSYAGHCHSLVQAIAQAVPGEQACIWAGKDSGRFWQSKGQIKPYFYRSLRKIQSYFLYRRLLKTPGKLLLSTAGTSDLLMLCWAANGHIPKDKVYLYVHWLGTKASKAQRLARVAKLQPNLEILCTTASTTDFFKNLGFRAVTVPYPQAVDAPNPVEAASFDHLLFAGAARMDKGFSKIADLVEDLAYTQAQWPFWVQTSATHQDKQGTDISRQIERLTQSRYTCLKLLDKTLSPEGYQALFSGAISIQPYSEADFLDRVSGVTLDALAAGCPVIVTANTWLGRVVLKHNAGVATHDLSPAGLRVAIQMVLSDYSGYSHRAAIAGQALRQEHSAASMMAVIFPSTVESVAQPLT